MLSQETRTSPKRCRSPPAVPPAARRGGAGEVPAGGWNAPAGEAARRAWRADPGHAGPRRRPEGQALRMRARSRRILIGAGTGMFVGFAMGCAAEVPAAGPDGDRASGGDCDPVLYGNGYFRRATPVLAGAAPGRRAGCLVVGGPGEPAPGSGTARPSGSSVGRTAPGGATLSGRRGQAPLPPSCGSGRARPPPPASVHGGPGSNARDRRRESTGSRGTGRPCPSRADSGNAPPPGRSPSAARTTEESRQAGAGRHTPGRRG